MDRKDLYWQVACDLKLLSEYVTLLPSDEYVGKELKDEIARLKNDARRVL